MVKEVGIRELKQRTSDILRRVREGKETVTITYRGRVVAHLVPAEDREARRAEAESVWADMDDLAEEVGALWPARVSAVDSVQDQRREL